MFFFLEDQLAPERESDVRQSRLTYIFFFLLAMSYPFLLLLQGTETQVGEWNKKCNCLYIGLCRVDREMAAGDIVTQFLWCKKLYSPRSDAPPQRNNVVAFIDSSVDNI